MASVATTEQLTFNAARKFASAGILGLDPVSTEPILCKGRFANQVLPLIVATQMVPTNLCRNRLKRFYPPN